MTPIVKNNPIFPIPIALRPILLIFEYGNSIPITKRSKMTPISAKRFNASISDKIPTPPKAEVGPPSGKTHDQNGERGPINIPANR